MRRRKQKVAIDSAVLSTISAHLDDLGADSVEAFINDTVSSALIDAGWLSPYSQGDHQAIEKHLRDLGYLD